MTNWDQGLGQATLFWSSLPFWEGPQDSPGVSRHCPLKLSVSSEGYLAQAEMGATMPDVVSNYADPKYGFITPPPGTSDWGTQLGEAKLRTLEAFVGDMERLRILEVGGGNLFLANKLRRKYAISRYVAIDPALRVWPEISGVEALREYFPSSDLNGETFDLVLAHNCLEHIPNTLGFLAAIRDALAPGGLAFLTFPDVARQFAAGDLNAVLHEHLAYLDEPCARMLFVRAGLAVVRWESEADLASCLLTRTTPSEAALFESARLATSLLARAVEGFCTHLPRAVRVLSLDIEKGRNVAFYGATNGLNSLLSITGIGRDLPILDGDRAKDGRFLPAGLSPIQWIGEASPADFERVFLTAGSFHAPIVRALTETYGVPRNRIIGLFRTN